MWENQRTARVPTSAKQCGKRKVYNTIASLCPSSGRANTKKITRRHDTDGPGVLSAQLDNNQKRSRVTKHRE